MIKDIVNGVLTTALLFAASVYLPLLGFFCAFFIPLPILYYRVKLDRFQGTLLPVISLAIAATVIGRVGFDLIFFTELLLVGWVLGEMFVRAATIEKATLTACLMVVGTALAGLLVYSSISGIPFYQIVSEYVGHNIELSLKLYREMGVSEDSIGLISESLDGIRYVLVGIIPALVIVYTLIVGWINLLLAKPLFERGGLAYPDFGDLKRWQAPEVLVWAVIGSGLLLLLPGGTIKLVGINGMLVLMTVYFLQGIAITAFFFEKKHVPRLLRILLYSLIAVQQILLLVVIGIGLFDVWLNLRKIGRQSNGAD